MFIQFEKWHGCKNDFVVTWMISSDRDTVLESLKRLAPKICSRDGSGIAADGILVLEVKGRKDLYPERLHIVNADGSIAENCGNGLRCAAMSVRRRIQKESVESIDGVSFVVEGRTFDCRFMGKLSFLHVAVTMPVPVFDEDNSWHPEAMKLYNEAAKNESRLKGDVTSVSVGNPHMVLVVPEASSELAATIGTKMQALPGGLNVHTSHLSELTDKDLQKSRSDIGEVIGELYTVWPWERGVGATQACGSGACAVAVTAYLSGSVDRRDWVAVDMPGGRLYVRQRDEDEEITLAGPATFVFEGSLEI